MIYWGIGYAVMGAIAGIAFAASHYGKGIAATKVLEAAIWGALLLAPLVLAMSASAIIDGIKNPQQVWPRVKWLMSELKRMGAAA